MENISRSDSEIFIHELFKGMVSNKTLTNDELNQAVLNNIISTFMLINIFVLVSFLVLMPFWLFMLFRKTFFKIQISVWLVIKTILVCVLVINELVKMRTTRQSTLDSILAGNDSVLEKINSNLMLITFIFAVYLIHYERFKGLPASTLMFLLWLFLSISSIVLIFHQVIRYILMKKSNEPIEFDVYCIHDLIYLTCIYTLLVVSLIPEKHTTFKQRRQEKNSPDKEVSVLSQLIYDWMTDLIMKGNKRDLTEEDFFKIDEQELCDPLMKRLEYYWNPVAKKYLDEQKNNKTKVNVTKDGTRDEKSKAINGEEKTLIKNSTKETNKKPLTKTPKQPSLALCLFKAYYGKFLLGSFLKLIGNILALASPLLLGQLISYVQDPNQSLIKGLIYALLIFLSAIVQAILLQQYFECMFTTGCRMRMSLLNLIFKKSMCLSNMARKETTVGEIVTTISVNLQCLNEFPHFISMGWSCVFSILLATILLWRQLGVASLAGLMMMFISIPYNSYLSNLSKKLQVKKLKHQDGRIKAVNEMLNGIKVVKLYAWEIPFQKLIDSFRQLEMKIFRKIAYIGAVSSFGWILTPFLVSISSFGIFVFIDRNNVLNAQSAFVSLALFNAIRQPLSMLPLTISNLIQANVAFKRLTSLLLKEELSENITHEKNEEYPIIMSNCNFGWDDEEAFLENITFKIKKGSLFAIVGKVGSGKSSILSSLTGETYKLSGEVNIDGTIAYAPQQAWIQNKTVRENILFGNAYDDALYNKVIEACSLNLDLTQLPAGDMTEIGEKGINLSGGQKQRISLARCVYSNADILLLDDSLSAVDPHVANHIFNSCIGPNGIIKDKTRVFVTNSLNFLPQVDYLIYVENGRIVDSGEYSQLIQTDGPFSDYYKTFLNMRESTMETTKNLTQNNENSKSTTDVNKSAQPNQSKIENSVKSASPNTKEHKIIEKEKVQSGIVKASIFMNYFRECKLILLGIFLLLNGLSSGFLIGSNFWLSNWSNKATSKTGDKLYQYGIYLMLGVIHCVFGLAADYMYVFMYTRASKNLHDSLLDSILHCGMQFFESTPIGRILNRFSKDVEASETKIPEMFRGFIRTCLNVVSVVIVISITTPFFIVFFIPVFCLFFFIQRYYGKTARQLKRLESTTRSPIYAFLSETLNGITTIRAFGSQKRMLKEMQHFTHKNMEVFYSDMFGNRWLAVRLDFVATLIILFVCLFSVIQKDSISPGLAGLCISYAINISLTLIWTVRSFTEFESNLVSIERIKEYCNLPHEADWHVEKNKPAAEWPSEGVVEFNDFSIKYREELDFVLKNISIKINSGEKIGIVGRTGAGKSSLTLSLFRILESNNGNIFIDGVNIKEIGLHDLRKKLTIIPQDPFVFNGTLRENLDPFGVYDDLKIWTALEHAHLKNHVSTLEGKLDFVCTEGGENLSVGQRQLLCLARALLQKSKILILDEATAAIDSQTDEYIQSTIKSEFSNCTVLTIAHRLNTTLNSDRIMVLDAGKVVEFDSPKVLLSNSDSLFHSMAKSAGLI